MVRSTFSTSMLKFLRLRLGFALSIIGPGLIAAMADNDAGGITTFSVAGATFGYQLVWVLLLITISLAITQEIGARTGAITGKGLAALIRENYGVRTTFYAMLALLFANQATTVSEFAGVAASLEIFGVPRLVSVPIAVAVVWLLVTRGTYKLVERVFLLFSLFYLAYVVSGVMVGPPWGEVLRSFVLPSGELTPDYLLMVVAVIGTTITPWGQFFIQAYVVDKGVTPEEYPVTRLEVLSSAVITDLISLFIIVTTAATLHVRGIHIEEARDAALALAPLAGPAAQGLFALGLLNASLLAASIVPLSTAYAVCEAFGWEAGVNRSFREAPVFNGLYTVTVTIGGLLVLLPGLPLVGVILLAQTINGILLPVILIFALQLARRPEIMGRHATGRLQHTIAWITVAGTIAASLLLVVVTLAGLVLGPRG